MATWTAIGCSDVGNPPVAPGSSTRAPTEGACEDAVQSGASDSDVHSSLPPGPSRVYVGRGDTYFIGRIGLRWGQSVEYSQNQHTYFLKVGIYTLDSHLPKVTVKRADGQGTGRATLKPTTEGIPGPVPTEIYFPAPGCWNVTAQGTTGLARIYVGVQPHGGS